MSALYRRDCHEPECKNRSSRHVRQDQREQAMSMTFYTPLTADVISFEAQGTVLMDIEKYELK